MEFIVGREVLDRADRCTRDYQCLNGFRSEPIPHLNGPPRFLCFEKEPCAYKIPFGNNFFCTCPVRLYIYEEFKT